MINISGISNILNKTKTVYVAYSGGLDSSALLYLCSILRDQNKIEELKAVHINHNLSKKSPDWESHCKKICTSLGIELISLSTNIEKDRDGIEAAARKSRYEAFSKIVKKDEQLLLAHHADDVAETILFRLFRGTGIDGLEGPKSIRSIGSGFLVRPLLKYSKKELHDFIKEKDIKYIEDETNKESTQDRNYIRNKVLPLINARWPNYEKRIQQTSEIIQERQDIFNSLFKKSYEGLIINNSIDIKALKQLELSEAKELFRYIIKRNNLAMPSKKVLDEIIKTFYTSTPTKLSTVQWSRADKEQKAAAVVFESGRVKICER